MSSICAAPGVKTISLRNMQKECVEYTPLDLDHLRDSLIRQEDTIVFALVERSQFSVNPCIYQPGIFDFPIDEVEHASLSFLDYFLLETEKVHSKIRRYTSPDEHPFFPSSMLPAPILPPVSYPQTIVENDINVNVHIKAKYTYLGTDQCGDSIVAQICRSGDDGNYGSSALCDVQVLQALSKRIHYGKFVAEVKFRKDTEFLSQLIRCGDTEGIWNRITNEQVENQVLQRIYVKASTYGKDPCSSASATKTSQAERRFLKPETIRDIYRDIVIPMTKNVQVAYLMRRI